MKSQITLVDQLQAANDFQWQKLQGALIEFTALAHPALCVIDLLDKDHIIRIKPREVIDLHVVLSENDWELCFALAEGLRPVGSQVPHWLSELAEGVFSRTTALVANPIRDEHGLTIGLIYAFYSEGTPDDVVAAYQRLTAIQCSSFIQQWQYGRRHQQLLARLWASIELSCPGFLILDDKMRIVEKGSIYEKAAPKLTVGNRFDQHFMWDSSTPVDDWNTSDMGSSKLRFYHALELNQRYKCTVQPIEQNLYLLLSNPVINSNHAMVDYHLTASDFPSHDYITDFVFLQTTTLQNLEELQRSNEIMQSRNKELELIQSDLLRNKMLLENRIEERNERVLRLLNFPEQNPNPVFEIDFTRRFICFSNKAAIAAFGDLLTLPYHELLAMLAVTHDFVTGSLKFRVEFESMNRYYEADAARVPNEDIVRFYARDISDQRTIKNLLARQHQGLNQLLAVLEAFNIDRAEVLQRANLSEVMQDVQKLLSTRN